METERDQRRDATRHRTSICSQQRKRQSVMIFRTSPREVARCQREHEHLGMDTETYFGAHAGVAVCYVYRVSCKTRLFRVSKFSLTCRYSETSETSYLGRYMRHVTCRFPLYWDFSGEMCPVSIIVGFSSAGAGAPCRISVPPKTHSHILLS